jgi:hypothetical protein
MELTPLSALQEEGEEREPGSEDPSSAFSPACIRVRESSIPHIRKGREAAAIPAG